MRCSAALRVKSTEDIQQRFNQVATAIWRQSGLCGRLGLAISGGVDSMALATLCSRFVRHIGAPPPFTAFIVDHGLREGSHREATKVATELRSLQIESLILNLDWKHHGDPSHLPNLETVARRLRYQALGQACHKLRIRSLLVAHHADDQAETVLIRLMGKYTGAGLQGIQPLARIPECQGIHGVDASGNPRTSSNLSARSISMKNQMQVEDGGVALVRPLLPFTKTQLIDVCRQAGTNWFEDHTNADRTLTGRNTIRHMQTTASLPVALQRGRIVALAEGLQQNMRQIETKALELLSLLSIELDPRVGSLMCTFDRDFCERVQADEQQSILEAIMLRKIVQLVSPRTDIALRSVREAAEVVLSFDTKDMQQQIAGVIVHTHRTEFGKSMLVHRETPYSKIAQRSTVRFDFSDANDVRDSNLVWSDWYLWDNRYWIRVGQFRSSFCKQAAVFVRFLTSEDVGLVRSSLDESMRAEFDNMLTTVSTRMRSTLPVLAVRKDDGERVMALPSMGWSRNGWAHWPPEINLSQNCQLEGLWEVRYRSTRWESGYDT